MDAAQLKRLDGIRGMAALGVAWVFHYIHFAPASNPFEKTMFHWFQVDGWILVDLFFILSGIIMSFRYSEEVRTGAMSGTEFFKLRFSRLYPVHFLTLLLVFVLHAYSLRTYGSTPIYGNFDSYHLGLNLLMLQKIVFDQGFSLNGPSWSVSIECFLYFLFYIFWRFLPKFTIPISVLFTCLGLYFTVQNPTSCTGRGLLGFFFGVIFYEILLKGLKNRKRLSLDRVAISSLLLLFVIGSLAKGSFRGFVGLYYSYSILIFPVFIYSMLIFPWIGFIFESRLFLWLGKISYSLYMIHVPVQIVLILVYKYFGLPIPAHQTWFAILYGFIIIGMGWMLHVLFEDPAKFYLRKFLWLPSLEAQERIAPEVRESPDLRSSTVNL